MTRSRTFSVAALVLAGTAAWAWSQGPVEPASDPAAGASSSETLSEIRTDRNVVVSGDAVDRSDDQAALSGDLEVAGEFIGIDAASATGDVLFEAAEPVAGTVRMIRADDGSQDVLWRAGPKTAPARSYRIAHHPQIVTKVRSVQLSPEEAEQQQEIRKWTEVLHSDRPADEKEKARKALSEILEKQFSRDLERREKEVAQLELRVKKLRTQVEKRREAKEKIIDLRLDTIEQEAEGLGFPETAPTRPGMASPYEARQPFTIKLDPVPLPSGRPRQ